MNKFLVIVVFILLTTACNPLSIFKPEKTVFEIEGCNQNIIVVEVGDLLSESFILQSTDGKVMGQTNGNEELKLACCDDPIFVNSDGMISTFH